MANFSIIVINHSADIDYKDCMNNFWECTSKPYYFTLLCNTTLLTDFPLRLKKNILYSL